MNSKFPPFPPFPPTVAPSSSSGLYRPEGTIPQSSTSSESPYFNSLYTYMHDLDRAIVPRMEAYEARQEELNSIIGREKIIEESTRRLLQINLIGAIAFPVVLVITFIVFCFYSVPNNVQIFFDTYKNWFPLTALITIVGFFVKPMYDIHCYNKRLDVIEKRLKLNGND